MKKILTFIIVVALFLETLMLPTFAAPKDDEILETYKAEILPVKGGASAIATLTFDDGVHKTNETLLPLLVKYNAKASLMVVPLRMQTSTGSYSSVKQLTEFAKDGYVDILSHSYTHLYMHDDGDNAVNNTPENITHEIVDSYKYLKDTFKTQYPISMAVPGGNYSDAAEEAMMKTYYAARYNNSQASIANMQSLTPTESVEPGGWYNLKNMWLKDDKIANGTLIAYLDACVEQGGWFFTGCHNFDPDGGNYDISADNLEILLEAMQEYQDSGELWIATFSEATRYLREYESSTVKQYRTKDAMFVEVTMAETTPGGLPLTEDIFNMPLTVKVEIPDGWTNVRFRQNGNETYVKSFKENGKTYALAEVAPNSTPMSITNGDEDIPTTSVKASFANAPGGATAIATLTFDDGLVGTANALNELCREYDCKASLMLISDRINETNVAMWRQIFAQGYLNPESHSSNHEYLTNDHPENLTPENIADEITGSLADLNKWFPDYDSLGYGIPYSSYVKDAFTELNKSFYSARGGVCVLSYAGYAGQMQSLDPKFGSANGSWYQLMGVRMMGEKGKEYPQYAVLTVDNLVGYLDKCVKEGGWFIGTAHGIVEGENLDITVEDLGRLMSVMQRYQNNGQLWVATMTDATKYIRERQSSTVTAYSTFDGLYVDVTMSDMTEDGLPLDPEVFNLPLTVKVELPESWGRVVYSQPGGEEKTAYAFTENGVKYAYIDLVPNGGAAYVTNIGDPTNYVESLGMKQNVSADDSLTYNIYIPEESEVIAVYSDAKKLEGVSDGNGYIRYSIGDLSVTSAAREFNFTLKFSVESGYVDYSFKKSVISYMTDLLASDEATEKDKQLAYDFLVYSRCMLERFSTDDAAKLAAKTAEEEAALLGFTSTSPTGTPADLGTATKVLTGAAFAINEKPYYVFYVNETFTGTLTLSYGEGAGKTETKFEIINGYYHCKHYVIFEVDSVYDLAGDITITATGTLDGTSVSASGAYSLANFVEGLGGEDAPEYVKALYSYVLSAESYNS